MKNLKLILILILTLSAAMPALADKMDSETQNQVISRLERVLAQMDKTESPWVGTHLRLADLLAERARLRFMNEIETHCNGCKGSTEDRKKAIQLYENVLNEVQKNDQGTVMLQLAHLYEMAEKQPKAQALYEKIITAKKGSYETGLVTRAQVGLADLFFQKNKNKEALSHYEIAFANPNAENRGLVLYRIAWCEFNLEHLPVAIQKLEKLLKSKELLTKMADDQVVYDPSFHSDVARDLATFYARRSISNGDIAKYNTLIPAPQRKPLLLNFADEAQRVGQNKAAYQIYQTYMALPDLTKQERLAGFVRLAQSKYNSGSKSTDDFAAAAMNFKEGHCDDKANCEETQKNMRKYVLELHRAQKTHPTMDVLKTYFIYVQTFPQDAEMAVLGGQLALDLKQEGMAISMFQSAVVSNDLKYRETALLGEIEAAERTKDLNSRETAYSNYLKVIPQGKKAFEIRYQLAQLSVDRKDFMKAARQFHDLALETTGPLDLRRKSADLALDSLAALKRDEDIENWTREFAVAFPSDAPEFRIIARKATTNRVVDVANNDQASKSELHSALLRLQAVDLRGASNSEKIRHYKNASILAQKSGDEAALLASLGSLLAIPSLTIADQEDAMARQVAVYEKHLDFRHALLIASKMKFPGLKKGERELRLGTLADLANVDPRSHYEAALKAGISAHEAASVRSRLVLISKSPVKELRRQKELIRDPHLMSETLLVVYARTHDTSGLAPLINDQRLAHTSAVRFIRKQPFYVEAESLGRSLARMKLQARTDKQLRKSIEARLAALSQADRLLKKALSLNDFTAQVMALNIISREYDRLTLDMMTLPPPKGLTKAEQAQYSAMLRQKVMPYFAKSKTAQTKLNEFWAHDSAIDGLVKEYSNSRPEVRAILENEMRILASIAPSDVKTRLSRAMAEAAPTHQDLVSAREAVRQNPSDISQIEKLKILETKLGHLVMASYLEARLGQMHRGEI